MRSSRPKRGRTASWPLPCLIRPCKHRGFLQPPVPEALHWPFIAVNPLVHHGGELIVQSLAERFENVGSCETSRVEGENQEGVEHFLGDRYLNDLADRGLVGLQVVEEQLFLLSGRQEPEKSGPVIRLLFLLLCVLVAAGIEQVAIADGVVTRTVEVRLQALPFIALELVSAVPGQMPGLQLRVWRGFWTSRSRVLLSVRLLTTER